MISPHPSAARCITQVAEALNGGPFGAGARGSVNWMTSISLEGTNELMRHRDVAVILATGGMGLVRAAYSAGKPAYGVGPGNAPCYIERSADVAKAASDILIGKSFDHGVLCSSPNSVVVDAVIADETKRQFQAQGGYFLTAAEADVLARALVTPQRLPNPKFVGQSALNIANALGFSVPAGTRALIAELKGVGRDYPLSIEKLCPVLSTSWPTGRKAASGANRFCGTAAWATPCRFIRQTIRSFSSSASRSRHSASASTRPPRTDPSG